MPDSFHAPSESFLVRAGGSLRKHSLAGGDPAILGLPSESKSPQLEPGCREDSPSAGGLPLCRRTPPSCLLQPSHTASSTGFLPTLTSFPISPSFTLLYLACQASSNVLLASSGLSASFTSQMLPRVPHIAWLLEHCFGSLFPIPLVLLATCSYALSAFLYIVVPFDSNFRHSSFPLLPF